MIKKWQPIVLIIFCSFLLPSSILTYREDDTLHAEQNLLKNGISQKFLEIHERIHKIGEQKLINNRLAKVSIHGVNRPRKVPICGDEGEYVLCRCPKTGRVERRL